VDDWIDAVRKIVLQKGGKKVVRNEKVDVTVMGPLLVYEDGGLYRLVHEKSGMELVAVETQEDAQRIGDVVSSQCMSALREGEKDKILMKVPKWVADWVLECGVARRCVRSPVDGEVDGE
jgi:hypothetical protein